MFTSKFGAFNGSTWEGLCQQVFKRKYLAEGYQQMPASPGDYGIEGFTVDTGWGFQCYCPDKHYDRSELYDKQRDKITEDLGKLKTHQAELLARLGTTKLCRWVFVTPEIDKNKLLAHARTKEQEVRQWGLPHVDPNFTVLLHDGDHYIVEINQVRSAAGEALIFDAKAPVLKELAGPKEDYERNVQRKCRARLSAPVPKPNLEERVEQLTQMTIESFLESDGHFRSISVSAPPVYFRLVGLINEYENQVIEQSTSWRATPEELTAKVREGLAERIVADLSPEISRATADKIARHMVARWLAVCQLNYD